MDETDAPQTPSELLVILAALADEGMPLRTIAPKFSGRFNKGVDYVGDAVGFAAEFAADIAVVRARRRDLRTARGPQAQRPLGERQVLDLPAHRGGHQASRGAGST